jgi:hypothetical protein
MWFIMGTKLNCSPPGRLVIHRSTVSRELATRGKSKDEALATLGSTEMKIENRRVNGDPNNRRSWKDVIILVQGNYFYLYHFSCMN